MGACHAVFIVHISTMVLEVYTHNHLSCPVGKLPENGHAYPETDGKNSNTHMCTCYIYFSLLPSGMNNIHDVY